MRSRAFQGVLGVICAVALLGSGLIGVPVAAAADDSDARDLPALDSEVAPAQKLEKPVAIDDEKFPETRKPSDANTVKVLGEKDEKDAPLPPAEPHGQGFVKGDSHRDDSATTPFQEIYDNPDGSHTVLMSPVPVRFQEPNGHWKSVDLSLVDGEGGKRATASPLPVTLLSDPSEGLTRWNTEDGPLITRLDGVEALADAKQSDALPNEVRWTSDQSVAARASITNTGVNQEVVLKDADAPTSYRFELVLPAGWSARQSASNGVELLDGSGAIKAFFGGGLAHDSSSPSASEWAETPVVVNLAGVDDGVALVDVGIDPKWLTDEKREFPVLVDPTTSSWVSGEGQGFDTYVDYFQPDSSFGTLSTLKSGPFTLSNNYALMWFPLTGGPPISHDTTISASTLTVYNSAGPGSLGHPMSIYGIGEWWNEFITWNLQPGTDAKGPRSIYDWYGTGAFGAAGWVSFDTMSLAESWVREGQANWGVMFKSTNGESGSGRVFESGNHAWYWPQLSITWTNGPKESIPVAPANDVVLTSTTPTLTVQTAVDEPVAYLYRVTTSPDAESGSVVWDSDWLTSTTSSTIPAGRLVDGGVYYWHVWTFKSIGGIWTVNRPTWVRKFRVDLRLGSGGVSPSDGLGPVAVNLATGNATVTAAGPSFQAVGGTVGATFTYNSQQPFTNGLLGRYFANATLSGDPKMQRVDQNVAFDWSTNSPGPGVPADNFSIRWTGFVTVPSTGNWTFSSINDYGVRVWVNNTLVLDRWSTNGLPNCGISSLPISLNAGQPASIKVEYRENTGNANFYLSADAPGGLCTQVLIPASWFTPDAPPLPKGWTFSGDLDGNIAATGGQLVGSTFVVTNADGSTSTYSWTGSAWKPPAGEDGTLTGAPNGELTLQESDGSTTVFNVDGSVKSVTSPLDDVHPAAPTYQWVGNPPRLKTITDPVSQRAVAFKYQSVESFDCPDPTAPGFDSDPLPSMLCRIDYWDGTSTKLFYSQGQLARIENPGGAITDFAYDNGKLSKVRDPLAADAVVSGIRADNDTTRWLLGYANGRLASITAPEPTAGASRPARTYSYDTASKTTTVSVSGITGTRVVTWDDAGRALTDADPTGKTTTIGWNPTADRPESITDPAGFKTTTIFDDAQRPTDNYGPAPSAWFGFDNRPTSGYSAQTPHEITRYDEGVTGLQVAYWNTKTLTGPTVAHDTGNVGPNGTVDIAWGTNSPVPGVVNTDGWSLRLSGTITIPTTGVVVFRSISDDGTRLYIDDRLIIDGWTDGSNWRGGDYNNLVANSKHRIRLEYYDNTGAAELHLYWNWQGQAAATVPGTNFAARYGLVTSVVDPDGKTSSAGYSAPHLGLATTSTTDPGGLNLTVQSGYEASGTGYYRQTTRTLPAGNQWAYTYYGDTEAAPSACNANGANQAGMLKTSIGPDPDNASGGAQPRSSQMIYDSAGRIIGTRIGSESWSCTAYDNRGRPLSVTIPAFGAQATDRTVTYTYAVGANPLQRKTSDVVGDITATIDLLGRVRSFTDVWGQTTATTYDQAGRATDSAGPLGAQHINYDDAGRVESMTLDGNVIADPAYDSYGRFNSVSYPSGPSTRGNGSSLAPVTRDSLGRVTGLTWRDPTNATLTSDTTTLSNAGRVTDETIDGSDAAPSNANFTYDGAARLDVARVPGHTLDYDYSPSGGCGALTTAGKNTDGTATTDNGAPATTYCYDYADRLTATTASGLTGAIQYDAHGNVVQLGGETFSYDGADRHVSSTANGTTVTYVRDATDRIVERHQTGPSIIAWRATSTTTTDGTTTDVTIAKPIGALSGDVLLAHIATAGGAGTTITPPAGWTEISTAANGTSVRSGSYWHLAAQNDPTTWTWTLSTAQDAAAAISAYTGIDTASPIDASQTATATATTSHEAPSVTTSSFGDLLVSAYAVAGSTTLSSPAGSTERADLSSNGASPITAEHADAILGAAGPSGPRTGSSSLSGDSVSTTVALRPAAIDATLRYGFTSNGDSPDMVLDAQNQILERNYGLPGGVGVSVRATSDVWSYGNLHGDVVAAADRNGTKTGGTYTYDPNGTPLSGQPETSPGEYDDGWLGLGDRSLEHANGLLPVVEMGDRQFIPLLGRFIESDPVDGGSANDYDYAAGDPVNGLDLNGRCGVCIAIYTGGGLSPQGKAANQNAYVSAGLDARPTLKRLHRKPPKPKAVGMHAIDCSNIAGVIDSPDIYCKDKRADEERGSGFFDRTLRLVDTFVAPAATCIYVGSQGAELGGLLGAAAGGVGSIPGEIGGAFFGCIGGMWAYENAGVEPFEFSGHGAVLG